MNDDSERKWVDERAFKILEFGKKEIFGMDEKVEALDNEEEWRESGCPLLTPRARAVLEAVEEAVKECVGCPYKVECDRRMRNGDVESWCRVANLAPIRKAYKENK